MVHMRTTIELDDDTMKAVEHLRRDKGLGLSEAVNDLIRRGALPQKGRRRFEQLTHPVGIKMDVSNVSEALEVLEGIDRR